MDHRIDLEQVYLEPDFIRFQSFHLSFFVILSFFRCFNSELRRFVNEFGTMCWKGVGGFRIVKAPSGHIVRILLASCWHRVGIMLASCWHHVGIMLGSCWHHVGIMLEECWHHVAIMFAHFGNTCGTCLGHL